MSAIVQHHPFSWRKPKSARITSANSTFQLTRVPWADPVNKRARIVSLNVANLNGVSTTLHLWDSDESSATPVKRGSAGAALIVVGVPAAVASGVGAGELVIGEGDLTKEVFNGGIAMQATQINVQVSAEIEYF